MKKSKAFIASAVVLANGPDPDTAVGFDYLETIFTNILHLAMAAAGIAVFVMLLIGGFKYLTSAGDPKAAESARGTLTWAIIGLFILIGAWFILKLIEEFTGVTVSTFSIMIK